MLVDTDVLIDLLHKHPSAIHWATSLRDPIEVPIFAEMELIQGCRNAAELRSVQNFLSPMIVVFPIDAEIRYAASFVLPLRMAHGIGILDSLIAAMTVGRGLSLATFNIKHFRAVPGTEMEDEDDLSD